MSEPTSKPTYNPSGRAFTSWVGGKSQLARRVIDIMPPHHCYCEVFAGAAWVLFKKTPSPVEVINDINGELVNLYRVIQHHLPEFARQFDHLLLSRDEYERLKTVAPDTLTDIQRAARYYYLLRLGYGGKVNSHVLSQGVDRPPALNPIELEAQLAQQHQRLSHVMIENQSYSRILERFDNERTLFYLDPPYWGCEDYYGKNLFERADFERLRDQLRGLKAKWILSLNNVPEIKQIFAEFTITEESVNWNLENNGSSKTRRANELLISNFGHQ